jgi:predicted Zn finger-like uncharacterized protein
MRFTRPASFFMTGRFNPQSHPERCQMYFVLCPNCGAQVEIPDSTIGPQRTDPWNVCRCDECGLGFDYNDQEVQFAPAEANGSSE